MADTWSRMSGWEVVLPPSRPDALDLARIRSITGGLDRAKPVGVLGSTPEFRDLLHEVGFQRVLVFERNLEHLKRMTRLRYFDSEETVVEGDWLKTLRAVDGELSLLLSDLTAGNIEYSRRAEFYDAITKALGPGGMFIDKNLTNPEGLLSIAAIRKKYELLPLNLLTANHFSCDAIFCSELQQEVELVDTSTIYRALEAALPGRRFARLIEAAHAITPENCVWYYGRSWGTLAQEYCQDLRMLARHDLTANQPYHKRAFQYLWQRPK